MARRNFAPPYRTVPPEGVVAAAEWSWEGPPGTGIDGSVVRGWDPALRFALTREIRFESARLAEVLGFGAERPIVECLVTCVTAGRKFRSVAFRSHVDLAVPTCEVRVRVEPDSAGLADSILLVTGLYLMTQRDQAAALSPVRAGSRLWEDHRQLAIEGKSPRPTMRTHSFSSSYAQEGMGQARYFIEVRASEPDDSFSSSVTINLNTDFPDFVTAVSAGEKDATREVFEAVVRIVPVHAIAHDLVRSTDPSAHCDGSIGRTVAGWLHACFPEVALAVLRKRLQEEPGKFEAQLQSSLAASLGAG